MNFLRLYTLFTLVCLLLAISSYSLADTRKCFVLSQSRQPFDRKAYDVAKLLIGFNHADAMSFAHSPYKDNSEDCMFYRAMMIKDSLNPTHPGVFLTVIHAEKQGVDLKSFGIEVSRNANGEIINVNIYRLLNAELHYGAMGLAAKGIIILRNEYNQVTGFDFL